MTGIVMNNSGGHPLDLAFVSLLENLTQTTTVHIGRHGTLTTAQVMEGW